MKQPKIKCRECDCSSLTCGIKKKCKIRGYKATHTFTKRVENKTNDNNNNNNNNNKSNNNNNISVNNDNNDNNMHREITAIVIIIIKQKVNSL